MYVGIPKKSHNSIKTKKSYETQRQKDTILPLGKDFFSYLLYTRTATGSCPCSIVLKGCLQTTLTRTIYFFKYETIENHAREFLTLIILGICR